MTQALTRTSKIGVLLLNLGTPDAPDTPAVRRYLREFLSDPRVIDIHPVGRWLLVNLIIAPFRSPKSAHAYKTVWTSNGSPLLFHGQALAEQLQSLLGDSYSVVLGMRYGNPSISEALRKLNQAAVDRILVVPLFPQYSSAATGSALDRVYGLAAEAWNVPPLEALGPFYDDPGFIGAFAAVARPQLDAFGPDHVLFSYHGLPERQIKKSDPTGNHCFSNGCCDRMSAANRYCYRAQCFATSRALVDALQLDSHSTSFQSRLGRDPWIKPYTDEVFGELARAGKKRLAVMCPAFVADCLETLEEIGMRGKEQWKAVGGEDLLLVPSLNSHPAWVSAVAQWVRDR